MPRVVGLDKGSVKYDKVSEKYCNCYNNDVGRYTSAGAMRLTWDLS